MKLLQKKLSLFIAQHKLFEFIEDCCQPITKYLFYVNRGDVLFRQLSLPFSVSVQVHNARRYWRLTVII